MGQYKVNYDEKAGSINMLLSGHFSDNDAFNYVNDFMKMSKKYQTSNTYLILDCGLLYIYPCDIKQALKDIFKMYKAFEYKLIRFKVFKAQKEMVNQFKDLCHDIGLDYDIFIVDRY